MRLGHLVKNVWKKYSLLRAYENNLVQGLSLSGRGIDLGAKSKDAKYYEFMDLSKVDQMEFVDYFHAGKDVVKMDLEKPFPIEDELYDFVLSFNVMEHIYNFHGMISESVRILKTGGRIHGIVPLMWRYHPDPGDYFRFTGESLTRLLQEQGMIEIVIRPIACGPFKVAASQVGQVVGFRAIRLIVYLAGILMDKLYSLVSSGGESYALAYYFSGIKSKAG